MQERPMRTIAGADLAEIPQIDVLGDEYKNDVRVVSALLPFKVNDYVLNELIDWSRVPDDPIFRLTFPDRRMLPELVFESAARLIRDGARPQDVRTRIAELRKSLNPHPSGQLTHNVPLGDDGTPIRGLQHKYAETVLVFPSQGQTCHAYCSYCFRWAQFVGESDLLFSTASPQDVVEYLSRHGHVSDVLLTGGDPLIMSTSNLAKWIDPILDDSLAHVRTIRIGTKALAYWPFRITRARDGVELLALFERCANLGRNVAVMMHVSHPRELETAAARHAVSALRNVGVSLYAQAPIIKHVNDDPSVWARLWTLMVELGIRPYYVFVERNTGANAFFEVTLASALRIYREAQCLVSGLARTARGPVMSTLAGKVVIDGDMLIGGRRVFQLRMLQARNAWLVGRTFLAEYAESATWIDDLQPAFDSSWPWDEGHPAVEPADTLVGAGA